MSSYRLDIARRYHAAGMPESAAATWNVEWCRTCGYPMQPTTDDWPVCGTCQPESSGSWQVPAVPLEPSDVIGGF